MSKRIMGASKNGTVSTLCTPVVTADGKIRTLQNPRIEHFCRVKSEIIYYTLTAVPQAARKLHGLFSTGNAAKKLRVLASI
jgi:hypothetical protein